MGKGGGGGHTPYEAPESGRSKQRIKMVEIISEGEIQGLVDGVKSVYFNKTPVQNADGSYNFKNMTLYGTIGSQEQDIMPGFNTAEKEIQVGVEVKKANKHVRTITDEKISRLRITLGVKSLFQQKTNGDTLGTTVHLILKVGANAQTITFSGKYSSQYLRHIEIDRLPAVPFNIEVERVEADSTSQRLQNGTLWASYTEIIDTDFAYPNTALAGVMFDSDYFNNLPQRNYLIRGIKVKVPNNYDPIARTYNGFWDGRFKLAWTNNPAWIFYDLITNKRYGLGQRLGDFGCDRWALYAIGQYCDVMVPDGFGGTEPRMTCNCWLTEQRQAYELIHDLASIFRAMPVWNGQQLTAIQDRPTDPVWTYTNNNVVNGEFERSYSALKARHNIIHVEYLDKHAFYERRIEYVSDDEAIKRYGANVKKVTAFGCTSRGQANRLGRWILATEKLEKETITFKVGREGLMHLPGDIIRVVDNDYIGAPVTGRILGNMPQYDRVILDRKIKAPEGRILFTYTNADGEWRTMRTTIMNYVSWENGKAKYHSRHIDVENEGNNIVVVTGRKPDAGGVWAYQPIIADKTPQSLRYYGLYRAVAIAENDDGTYTITALQHEPQKEAIVDNGAKFIDEAKSLYTAPQLTAVDVTPVGGGVTISAEISSGYGVVTGYDLIIYRAGQLYSRNNDLKTVDMAFNHLPNGDYTVVIMAKDPQGRVLSEKTKSFTIDRPPTPTGVTLTNGLDFVMLMWDFVDDNTQTEIFCAESDDIEQAVRVAKVNGGAYSHSLAAEQVRYYWLRHVRGQNVGDYYQQQGLRGETGEDLDKQLTALRQQLQASVAEIDSNLAAKNLEAVKVVATLGDVSQYQDANLVYNRADAKLYTWDGQRYQTLDVDSVPADKITGKIPTTQLSGQITDAQVQSVSAAKLSGTIAAERLANLPTSKLTGTIGAAQIAANAIGSRHIAAESISASKLTLQGDNLCLDPMFTDTQYWSAALTINNASYQATVIPVSDQHLIGNCWRVVANARTAANADYGLGLTSVKFPVESGKSLFISCFVRKLPGFVGTIRLAVERFDQNGKNLGQILGRYIQDSVTDEWKLFSFGNNTPLEPQVRAVRVYLRLGSVNPGGEVKGTVYFYNPTLRYMSEAKMLVDGAITTAKLAANAVAADKLQANSVTAGKIAANAVTAGAVQAGAITTDKLAANAVTADKLRAGSVLADKLAAGAVTAEKIAAGAVSTRQLAANAVTAKQIAAKAISADKLNVSSLSAISANLGTISGGSITGTTIKGNTITGGTISGTMLTGTTITGGTIRGATIEGVTVRAENIIGDVVKFYVTRAKKVVVRSKTNYQYPSIVIPPEPRNRHAVIMPITFLAQGSDGGRYSVGGDKEHYYPAESKTVSLRIKLNGSTVASASATSYSSTPVMAMLSDTFTLPANTTCTITFENGNNYIASAFTFLVQQA